MITGNIRLADPQRSLLDQHGRNRPLRLVESGLNNRPLCHLMRVGTQFQYFSLQQNHLQQIIQPKLLLGGNLHKDGVTAPLFGDQLQFGELLLNAIRICVLQIDLVNRNNNGDIRSLGMGNGFPCLWHHAIIGRHHQDHDIGNLSTACTHGGEGFVAWGIQEDNSAFVRLNFIGADMLCNAASFGGLDICLPDGVEQRRLAVVNMAHNRYNRCTRFEEFGRREITRGFRDFVLFRHKRDSLAQILQDVVGNIDVDNRVDGSKRSEVHQLHQHVLRLHLGGVDQILHG